MGQLSLCLPLGGNPPAEKPFAGHTNSWPSSTPRTRVAFSEFDPGSYHSRRASELQALSRNLSYNVLADPGLFGRWDGTGSFVTTKYGKISFKAEKYGKMLV
jgi:hypothetical protein